MRDTQRAQHFAALASAFSDLTAHLNQAMLHNRVLEEVGVALDAALARLLVAVHRHGPIGVVDLSDRSGRDHTTVSRQAAKLFELGLVERRENPRDRRVSKLAATASGARMARELAIAHQNVVLPVLDGWSEGDLAELTRLMRRLANDVAQLRAALVPA